MASPAAVQQQRSAKIAALREKVKARVDEVANVQSHVKLVTEGIRELMQLDPGGSSRERNRGGFD